MPPGALVIPSTADDGRPGEPRILVPVNGPRPRAAATNSGAVTDPAPVTDSAPLFNERVLTAQVALGRRAISSGPFDGVLGPQTRAALRAFQEREGASRDWPARSQPTEAKLALEAPLYTNYVVTAEDLARLLPLGKTWLAKSEQPRLDYENVLELVSEKTHSSPKLLRWLNPEIDWDQRGELEPA